ncbi:hypothetical protein MNBD_GAMMA07-1352 [hydrothermal vent metagenome]|uniref:Chalcone isomerase domain-containing protein n=1 Tax=hydrothermal vent metagenome TaxID=652676 RepID=A0A3B0WMT5_9ZZZZ
MEIENRILRFERRKFLHIAIVGLFLSLFNTHSFAREIAGVKLSETISVKGIDQPLVLNGAGIRYKYFFKIYVAALYIPEKRHLENIILRSTPEHPYQANRVVMHFLYGPISQVKIANSWVEGFKDNLASKVFSRVQARLYKFNRMFKNVYEGDVVLLDYLPNVGTRVTINGLNRGVIKGADFNHALLLVWLGDNPVVDELKDALLGIEDE